jgi:hypothetical protein
VDCACRAAVSESTRTSERVVIWGGCLEKKTQAGRRVPSIYSLTNSFCNSSVLLPHCPFRLESGITFVDAFLPQHLFDISSFILVYNFIAKGDSMKNYFVPTFVFATLALSAVALAQNENAKRPEGGPPAMGIHWAKGVHPASAHGKSPNMLWHNGPILTDSVVQVIYWGPSWGNNGFVSDKISGLTSWYTGFSGSNYAKTSDEYSGTNGQVGPSNTLGSDVIDFSAAGSGAKTSTILAEVCRKIINPVANGYYPVYVDLPRGHAGYCAYHSWGSCGSTPVQFAFFWNLDGDPGCDPEDTSGLHSQGLAALANVSGHELSEARTDPTGLGWFDASGEENGDKCAWTFNVPLVTFSNRSKWKIQGEWSNAAFNAGTGYSNSSGQKGCLDGR